MTVIYFVRHGQTDWNKVGLFRGRADRSLDEVGKRQGQLVADALKDKGIKGLYSSPMQRTIQTLSPTSRKIRGSSHVTMVNDLIDIDYGDWQGVSKTEVPEKWPDIWKTWREDPFSVTFPNGESLIDVQKRALTAVDQIRNDCGDTTVAVCTHRVILKVLFCGFVGAGTKGAFYSFKLDPASISIVRFHGDLPVIVTLNDAHHLRGDDALGGPQDF